MKCILFFQKELSEWVDIVKTSRFKELPPYDPKWYYIWASRKSCSAKLALMFLILMNRSLLICTERGR
jgi:hypothetical protein